MKKKIIIIITIILFIAIAISVAYAIDMHRMKNNKPVVFSCWGYNYAPQEEISQIAVEKAIEKLDDKIKKTIINIDNPKVEEYVFNKQPFIYFFGDEVNLVGKSVYKITFNTIHDGLLGPIVIYVDMMNFDVIGTVMRNWFLKVENEFITT